MVEMFKKVLDHFNTQEICDKAVKNLIFLR